MGLGQHPKDKPSGESLGRFTCWPEWGRLPSISSL